MFRRLGDKEATLLLKVDGSDTQFAVDDSFVPLTDRQAVLINAWEAHAYVHQPASPRHHGRPRDRQGGSATL